MKLLTLIAMTFCMISTQAAVKENYKCSSMRKNIEFKIKGNHIQVEGRTPAQSLVGRTHKVGNSMTKHYQYSGKKF
mgnify:CR=1 FL=1